MIKNKTFDNDRPVISAKGPLQDNQDSKSRDQAKIWPQAPKRAWHQDGRSEWLYIDKSTRHHNPEGHHRYINQIFSCADPLNTFYLTLLISWVQGQTQPVRKLRKNCKSVLTRGADAILEPLLCNICINISKRLDTLILI
jgi:hypothetical protein